MKHHDIPHASPHPEVNPGQRLKLLSYNIQVGIASRAYREYLTSGWKHVLPSPCRTRNLDQIAEVIGGYDIVGLQEVDAGSFRSQFINQAEYLAQRSNMPFWEHQTNRDLGHLAKHSLGMVARYQPYKVEHRALPGLLPGRGVMLARFGTPEARLTVAVMHLALGRGSRMRQMGFVADLLAKESNAILMGDFNCLPHAPEMRMMQARTGLVLPDRELHTYPSWRPNRMIDYILVTPTLRMREAEVLHLPHSDHLPLAVEVELPPGLTL
ncbi:MAG: EEP domain-containing protein [Halothiobacillaceae bacterium]|nr:MAG: EEP domain-containing protein [Halothiobacillaceae bacterium]